MKINYITKNYSVNDRMRTIIEKKLERIQKYFDSDASATIVCTKVGNTEKMEITITSRGHAFRAQEENRSMYSNIDFVLSKIERQIVKNKEKLQTVIRREAVDEKKFAYKQSKQVISAGTEVKKTKSFDIKVLTNEQAEVALATLDHNFFIYANQKTGRINVMYRRSDGHVGIIEVNNAGVKVDYKAEIKATMSDVADYIVETGTNIKNKVKSKMENKK